MSSPHRSKLKAWRARNGYTQEELAHELKVSRQSVVKWERYETLDRVLALALLALEEVPQSQQMCARRALRAHLPSIQARRCTDQVPGISREGFDQGIVLTVPGSHESATPCRR